MTNPDIKVKAFAKCRLCKEVVHTSTFTTHPISAKEYHEETAIFLRKMRSHYKHKHTIFDLYEIE